MRVFRDLKKRLKAHYDWIVKWHTLPVLAWIDAAEHYKNGEYQRASELYLIGLKSHPHNRARLNAYLDLAHCLFLLHKYELAESYLRRATSTFPKVREGYVRLARLQLWLGYASEALWTVRVCIQRTGIDPEILTLFISAVVDAGGNPAAVAEAREHLKTIYCDASGFPHLEAARARLDMWSDNKQEAREEIARLAQLDRGPFEAVVSFAEILISEGKLAYARHHLHRALTAAPDPPRVMKLLARTHLYSGVFYEPEYAVKLAQKACQMTGWRGINEVSTLAQAYLASGDKIAALLVATKAKEIAVRLIGGYPEVAQLKKMLQVSAGGVG